MKTVTLSLRVPRRDVDLLDSYSSNRASRTATVGAELLSRAVRSLIHPAIDFERTPDGGSRARLSGYRVAVWIVVDMVRRSGRKKTAEALNLPPSLVAAALDYAADYQDEIKNDAKRGTRSLKDCGLEGAES